MGRYPIYLVTREMEMKTRMRHHFMLTRIAIVIMMMEILVVVVMVMMVHWNSHTRPGGVEKGTTSVGNSFHFLKNLKLAYGPAIPFLHI